MKIKLFLSILILFTLFLSACSTNQTQQPNKITDTLTLSGSDSEGYYFKSTTSAEGAFLTQEDIEHYNLTDIQTGDTVSMTFDQYGDIVEVNE
jgi:hypothetical protein